MCKAPATRTHPKRGSLRRLAKLRTHPKVEAILFEDIWFARAYQRGSSQCFWAKVATGTKLRPSSRQAALVTR